MNALGLVSETPADEGFEQRLQRIRERRLAAVELSTLRWLALLPEWTSQLARVGGFPGGVEALEEARRARLCEARVEHDLSGRRSVRYWMPSSVRTWLLQRWQRQPDVRLGEDIGEIAGRVLRAQRSGVGLSPGIRRWAELASAELADRVVTGDELSRRVGESLAGGDISSARDWIFAGEHLGGALGARMRLAARRARRRISLHYRLGLDERYLRSFIRRHGQMAELEQLIGPGEQWAAHFIGPGGVGKTMLMRFITSSLEDNPFKSTARVDFDYIDPRLPLENPARLLQELGEGLALGLADGTQEALFRSFLEAVAEAERGEPTQGERLGSLQDTPQFGRASEAFARFLDELPGPIALVLDTCEELAKLHPPGEKMQTISATFRILTRLRKMTPKLHVVVAGRRWLTWSYANVVRDDDAVPDSVRKMEPFQFMTQHEVLGFSEAEADRYLEKRELKLRPEMLDAVRRNTIDRSSPPAGEGYRHRNDEPRYSPNDLDLIASWLEARPDLEPRTLAEGDFDPYVEARIIERVEGDAEILAALPLAMLLERFDGATIRPLLAEDPADRSAALQRLIEADWTHLEGGPEPDDVVLKVDAGLLPRLRAYYANTAERRATVEAARETLREHLAEVLERPPSTATVEGINAALRLLPAEESVPGFDRLAERVAREPAWEWAEELCERLLSPDREPRLSESLRPSVFTLYIATLKQRGATVDLTPYWRGVEGLAESHPDRARATVLAARGRLCALAAEAARDDFDGGGVRPALSKGRLVLDQVLERGAAERPGDRREPDRSVAPALLAAIEALIDAQEERGVPLPRDAVSVCLGRLHANFEGERSLQAYVLVLAGRMHALGGEKHAAEYAFERALGMGLGASATQPCFADWVAPDSIAHRVMLELLRFRLREGAESDELLERCEAMAHELPGGADGAQLLSLALQARLARGDLGQERLWAAAAVEETAGGHAASAPAHRCAPPLFATLAEAWLTVADADRALAILARRERQAVSGLGEESSARDVARATLRLHRRLRLRERLALVSHSTGDEELRGEALAAGALIAGVQPMSKGPVDGDHDAWRARILLDQIEDRAPILPEGSPVDAPEDDLDALHGALDRLEFELVEKRFARLSSDSRGVIRAREQSEEARRRLVQRHQMPSLSDPLGDAAARIELRVEALLGPFVPMPGGPRMHQRARLALEEGELLGLRAPDRAALLLGESERCFAAVEDPAGAFLAALAGAIAQIHAGQDYDARARMPLVLQRYEDLRRLRDSLPAVWVLFEKDDAEHAIDPTDPWRAWVWRLFFYLRWCGGQGEDARAENVAMEFGPEFQLKPARGAVRRAIAPQARAKTRRAARAAWAMRWLPLVPVAAVCLALGFGTSVWASGGALLLLSALVASIELVGPRLPRRILPLGGFQVWLLAPFRTPSRPTELAAAGMVVLPWARGPMRLYLRLQRRRTQRIDPLSAATPGGRSAESTPKSLQQALRPQLIGGYPPLRLVVDQDIAHVPWERRLTVDLNRRPDWHPLRSPRIHRIRPPGFSALPARWPRQVSAVCAPIWRQFLEASARERLVWLDEVAEASVLAARGVIALGVPIMTDAGWRLRLDDEELPDLWEGRVEPREHHLVSPDGLTRAGTVVVLVGSPSGGSLRPDRRSSDGLRSLATEAFLAGAHAVIVVPVLPHRLAAAAVDLLSIELSSWPDVPDLRRLQSLVAQLQTLIYEAFGSHAEEKERLRLVELALDVCLYAPGDWKRG